MNSDLVQDKFNDAARDALSLEQAIALFDDLADMEDIAFGYPRDGCYARAHIMCRRLMEQGLTPQKAWAFEGSDALIVQAPDGREIMWWYHVAPTLAVRTSPGEVRDLVFDPSLFDGPVSLREWGEIMGARSEKQLEIAPFGKPPQGYKGDYEPHTSTGFRTDKRAKNTMDNYLQQQDGGQRVVFQSQSRQQMARTQQTPATPQGKTWTTALQAIPQPEIKETQKHRRFWHRGHENT